MVKRDLSRHLRKVATRNPAVTVMGPRQAGKTTLCQQTFPDHDYQNLELPDTRAFAETDPRGFLRRCRAPVILDEIQRAPDLLSYIQVEIDADPRAGRFILTGSQHMGLHQALSQSLAGRTALLTLLPFALGELREAGGGAADPWEVVSRGGYPAIFDRGLPPREWLEAYIATYVERDVRALLNIGDLRTFQTFLGLCAGRVGQLVNLSALAADAGVSQPTAKAWLSVLEASFIVHLLPPFFANVRKRLVKTPKLCFLDTGLVCTLLGIHDAHTLRRHPLRGAIFESWVVSEVMKHHLHHAERPRLSHYRDRSRLEVDLVSQMGQRLLAVEIKSGETVASDFFAALTSFGNLMGDRTIAPHKLLVYAGADAQERQGVAVVPWSALDTIDWLGRD